MSEFWDGVDANRVGEFHEGEILELSPGDFFERSVFIDCEFNAIPPWGFKDCQFIADELEHGCPCLIRSPSKGIQECFIVGSLLEGISDKTIVVTTANSGV